MGAELQNSKDRFSIKREKRNFPTLVRAAYCLAQEITALRLTAEAASQLIILAPETHYIFKNSLALSFAIHFRNVFDFLYSGREHSPKKNDIVAEDFFENPTQWHSIMPNNGVLKPYRIKLNKQMAHLTHERIGRTANERFWDVSKIIAELKPALHKFTSNVDPKISKEVYVEINNPRWQL